MKSCRPCLILIFGILDITTKPKIAIRVSTLPEFGGGHVARCLAVANEIVALGASVLFIADSEASDLVKRIRNSGFFVILDTPTCRESAPSEFSAVLFDSSAMTLEEFEYWKRRSKYTAQFDDTYSRKFECDLSFVAVPDARISARNEVVYTGIDYIPLDAKYREFSGRQNIQKTHCVVAFGLFDGAGGTTKALTALHEVRQKIFKIDVTVIIGSHCKNLPSIKQAIHQMGSGVNLLVDCVNVPDVLKDVNLAVGAGGLSLYERACMGIANIALPIADNQKPLCHWLSAKGGCIHIAPDDRELEKRLFDNIKLLIETEALRNDISRTARELVDGLGAIRIANLLVNKSAV